MGEEKVTPEQEESRIHSLIEQLYAPYLEDNYDEPWYIGEDVSREEEEEIEDKLHAAVAERFKFIGRAYGEISGGGLGWSVRMSYWMWPEPLDGGKSWHMYSLWYNDDGMQWEFCESGYVELEGGTFAQAAYEMLKAEKPELDGDADNKRVDADVEGWRRLSLGLPREPRHVGPFVERTQRFHGPYRWSVDGAEGNDSFWDADWRILTQLGYELAKQDGILHPAEDRLMVKWWKEVTGRILRYADGHSKSMADAFEEWDETGAELEKDLQMYLESMSKDKRIRMCQLLHRFSMVDGRVTTEEMDCIRRFAKKLSVPLFDDVKRPSIQGALRDGVAMEAAKGDVEALKAFAPTWLFLPLPVLSAPIWGEGNEMAVVALQYGSYRLHLFLGSDADGNYLRAEDSECVTWPERRISLRARTEEVMDYLLGQEGYMVAYPHRDAHDPERHEGVPSPLWWGLGEVEPDGMVRERDFRGWEFIRCRPRRALMDGASGELASADERIQKMLTKATHRNGLDVYVHSEFWPLADALEMHFKGLWA